MRTVEEVGDVLVMEQFLESLSRGVKIWVRERRPKSVLEAGELADQYDQARKAGLQGNSVRTSTRKNGETEQRSQSNFRGSRTCYSCGGVGHLAKDCNRKSRENE